MEQELIVTSAPIEIISNFEAFKAELALVLKEYSIEVTEENLAAAKKAATDLNKKATEINKRKIEKAKEFSAPIRKFEEQAAELVKMCQDGRAAILDQVKVFEDKTRASCRFQMNEALTAGYLDLGVRPEYQTGFTLIEPLVGLSMLTKGGTLTKAAQESVMGLAQQARGLQDRTDGRIARLEAECLKAGLTAPLQRDHVEKFLRESDAVYDAQLSRLIKIEVDRQEKHRAKIQAEEERKARASVEEENRIAKAKAEREAREAKEKADREAAEKAASDEASRAKEKAELEAYWKKKGEEAARAAQPPAQEPETIIPKPIVPEVIPPDPLQSPPISAKPINGKQPCTVTVRFQISAKRPADIGKIVAWFEQKIQDAGITDPHTIEVETDGYAMME